MEPRRGIAAVQRETGTGAQRQVEAEDTDECGQLRTGGQEG
jgi:hypothetical protein